MYLAEQLQKNGAFLQHQPANFLGGRHHKFALSGVFPMIETTDLHNL